MKWVALIVLIVSQNAWTQSRTQRDEDRLHQVCRSADPVLVIDTFKGIAGNEEIIDLNGDGSYDVYHGELVEKLLQLNGQRTIRHNIPNPIFSDQLAEELSKIVTQVQSGSLKISAINFSQGYEIDIASFNNLLGDQVDEKITDKNIHKFSRQILEELWTSRPRLKLKELNDALVDLERLGIPFIVAASNAGWREVNVYSLFPNVISVGALTRKDKKAAYSADNSAITIWRLGNIESYRQSDGIDLNSDGQPDFTTQTPAISYDLATDLASKHIDQVLTPIPRPIEQSIDHNRSQFFDVIKRLPKGVYKTKKILSMSRSTPFQNAQYMTNLGQYFYLDGHSDLPRLFFQITSSGNIAIDPQKYVNDRQYRNLLLGTSFAAPNFCNGQTTPSQFAQ